MYAIARRLTDLGRRPWAVPLGLLVAILLTFGPFVPWLGFYWDDWPNAWFNYLQGPGLYWKAFSADRPILPWLYSLTTPWLGTSPPAWQAFVVVARWVAAGCVWWMIRMIWPQRERVAALAAFLAALYPGFKQAPMAIIYSHFYILYGMSFASIGLMIGAVRLPSRRRVYLPIALILEALSIFSIEYTVGLELLRPILLWMAQGDGRTRGWGRIRAAVVGWAPYALLFAAYIAWRTLGLGFPTYQPLLLSRLQADAWVAASNLLASIGQALWTATGLAWAQMFEFPVLAEVGRKYVLGYVAIVVAVGAWALACQQAFRSDPRPDSDRIDRTWPLQAMLLGLAAMLAGGLPVWVTQLPVRLDYPWDRLTLPMMLGAVLVASGLLELLARPKVVRIALVSGILALSAGVHYRSNMTYVRAAERLGSFLWQLSWRIPGLDKGTTVVTNDIPLGYYSDNSLTAALNWMYSPANRSLQMDYMLYYPTVRVGLALSTPEAGLPIDQPYRAASFTGSTSQMLALQYAPPGCVHVLDVIYDDSMPNLPATLSAWVPLSRLDLIQVGIDDGPIPPLYPEEPRHDWCFYFEKADLARQRGDWQSVAELGDEGFAVDHPNDPSERLVFIEGYARVGRWDGAEEQSRAALEQNPAVDRMVCHTWDRILEQVAAGVDGVEAAERIRALAACEIG
jgi:hypothetical protein